MEVHQKTPRGYYDVRKPTKSYVIKVNLLTDVKGNKADSDLDVLTILKIKE